MNSCPGVRHGIVQAFLSQGDEAAFAVVTGHGDEQGLRQSEHEGQGAFACWQGHDLQPAGGSQSSSSSLCQRDQDGLAQSHGLSGAGHAGAHGFVTHGAGQGLGSHGTAHDFLTTGAQGLPQGWAHGLATVTFAVAQAVPSVWPHVWQPLCSSRSSRLHPFFSQGVGQLWHASVPVTAAGESLAGPVPSGVPGTWSTPLARQAAISNHKERLMASCLRPQRNAGLS